MTHAMMETSEIELEDLFDLDVRELPAEESTQLEAAAATSSINSYQWCVTYLFDR